MTASPRTLRAWRRIGLVLGVTGGLLLLAGTASWLALGRDHPAYAVLAVAGLLAGLVAVVFLRRVWSEPGWPGSAPSRWGRRLSSAFVGLWAAGVLLNPSGLLAVPAPSWLRVATSVAMSLALAATVVAALLDRPEPARG